MRSHAKLEKPRRYGGGPAHAPEKPICFAVRSLWCFSAALVLAAGCNGRADRDEHPPPHIVPKPSGRKTTPKAVDIKTGKSGARFAPGAVAIGQPVRSHVDLEKSAIGKTRPHAAPGNSGIPDGASLLQHFYGGKDGLEEKKADAARGDAQTPPKEKSDKTPGKAPSEAQPDAASAQPPSIVVPREVTADNAVRLIRKGTSGERAEAMVYAGQNRLAHAVPAIEKVLREEGPLSGIAADALAAIGTPRAVSALHGQVRHGRVPEVRARAFAGITVIDDPAADRVVMEGLSSRDAGIRYWAVRAAALRSYPGAQKALESIVSDPGEPAALAVWAAAALERLSPGDPAARRTLLAALRGREPYLSSEAIQALAAAGSSWAFGAIAGLVYSDNPAMAREIFCLLQMLPPAEALEALDSVSTGFGGLPRYRLMRAVVSRHIDGEAVAAAILSQDALARELALETAAVFKVDGAVRALGALARSTSRRTWAGSRWPLPRAKSR